jgi:hypothetical protein
MAAPAAGEQRVAATRAVEGVLREGGKEQLSSAELDTLVAAMQALRGDRVGKGGEGRLPADEHVKLVLEMQEQCWEDAACKAGLLLVTPDSPLSSAESGRGLGSDSE